VAALATAQAEKPVRQNAAGEEGIELGFDKLRQTASTLRFDLRQEAFEVVLNQPIEGGFFGTAPLVMDWVYSRRALERWAHDLCLVTSCLKRR
jgi:hypothetical protein